MSQYHRLGQELAYRGKLVALYKDYLVLPNGKHVVYDLIKHNGGAAVLPIDSDGKLIFVRQYRNSVDAEVLEIPAGCKNTKEELGEICALRELEEEIGYTTNHLEFVAEVYGAIGVCDEKTDIYIADNLMPGNQHWDDEEFIKIERYSLKEAIQMICNKEIIDSKTVIAVMAYHAKLSDLRFE